MTYLGLSRSMSIAALVLPLLAAGESQFDVGSAAPRAARPRAAAAHLNFKIVIPQVLSLDIPGGARLEAQARASIGSNGRSVALAATRAADAARRDVVLTAAAGRNLVREADCVPDAPAPAARVTCTASMP